MSPRPKVAREPRIDRFWAKIRAGRSRNPGSIPGSRDQINLCPKKLPGRLKSPTSLLLYVCWDLGGGGSGGRGRWRWQGVTLTTHFHPLTRRGIQLTLRRRTTYIYVALWRSLTLRRLMSYIYGAPILDVSRSHTTTQHSR